MALAFNESQVYADSVGSATNFSPPALTVAANSLIIVGFKWEGANGATISGSGDAAGFSFTTIQDHSNGDMHWCFGYLLAAASGSRTYVFNLSAARTFRSAILFEFTADSVATDGSVANSQSTVGSPSSGNITTTGTDGVAIGLYAEYSVQSMTSPLINSLAADGAVESGGGNFTQLWYKLYATGFTGQAAGTLGTSANWGCGCMGFKNTAGGASVAVTGTAVSAITETDIRSGGKTIILTLTGDTYVAAGTGPIGSIANTQALISGIDSGQAESTGWDALVKNAVRIPGDVVRTSSTVATITLPGVADYNITATETITATVPGAVLTGANPLVATPTFTVSSDGSTPDSQDLTGAMVGM